MISLLLAAIPHPLADLDTQIYLNKRAASQLTRTLDETNVQTLDKLKKHLSYKNGKVASN